MNTLFYAPDQNAVQLTTGDDRLQSQVGAISKFRRNQVNNDFLVDVGWNCSKKIYAYLTQAYRASVANGGDPFLCELFLETAMETDFYPCRFVAGSFGLASVSGETYQVKARFSVTPDPYDADTLPFDQTGDLFVIEIEAETGVYVLSGKSVTFRPSTTRMQAATGAYVLNGRSADLSKQLLTRHLDSGTYVLTGGDVTMTKLNASLLREDGLPLQREDGSNFERE